jgi:hypothetical protein
MLPLANGLVYTVTSSKKCAKYCTRPKNLCMSLRLHGVFYSLIFAILSVSTCHLFCVPDSLCCLCITCICLCIDKIHVCVVVQIPIRGVSDVPQLCRYRQTNHLNMYA